MASKWSLLVFLAVFTVVGSEPIVSTVHWQWRDLICETENGHGADKISEKPAECSIALRESERDTQRRTAAKNAGCFDEVVNGTTRSYCDILCPGADTVYLIKRTPQVHRSCFVFFTHRLERRGENWYLWRHKEFSGDLFFLNKRRDPENWFGANCALLLQMAFTQDELVYIRTLMNQALSEKQIWNRGGQSWGNIFERGSFNKGKKTSTRWVRTELTKSAEIAKFREPGKQRPKKCRRFLASASFGLDVFKAPYRKKAPPFHPYKLQHRQKINRHVW